MDVRELAVNVAVRECGGAPDEIPERVIERVQQSLYHAHLPKLHESGVVSYSRAQGAVRLADDIEEVESVISAVFNEWISVIPFHAMSEESAVIGDCPHCGREIRSAQVLVTYETDDGTIGIFADCADCDDVVRPE